ncbi:MAG TPA: hypothetical protein VJQ58_06345 [Burkholderiales bacterium]|nr:hypothetical protein [Burkholderiales bacterium]
MTVTLFLLLSLPALAQELPDPGRRLSKEELEGAPQKSSEKDKPRSGPRDANACERARQYYTITCGALDSRRSHSQSCGEAYALYRQSCS